MSSSTRRVELRSQLTLALAAAAVLFVVLVAPARGDAHTADANATVVYDGAGDAAPDIGLIGDSSLAGVRWNEAYGDLRQFNYVFNAESCRRTVETSCWSREGYRPDNAVTTMQELGGQWGDLLIVMSGYNDTHYLFDDAVDSVVEEAQRQGIPQVMWLTLRTADVSYEEPLHQANGSTYDESNRMLFDAAEEHGDYLQIADWATHSAGQSEWVTGDGVHLTSEGATELTSFIADHAEVVLDGETVTPAQRPWVTLSAGDIGDAVTDVQRTLMDEGISSVGEADGEYGDVTSGAVQEFQRAHGLDETGVVDMRTAVALGLYETPGETSGSDDQPATDDADRARVAASSRNAPTADGRVDAPDDVTADAPADGELTNSQASMEPGRGSGSSLDRRTIVAGALIAIAVATAIAVSMRRRALRRQRDVPPTPDPTPPVMSSADETRELDRPDDLSSLVMIETDIDPPYDHEQEAVPADAPTTH